MIKQNHVLTQDAWPKYQISKLKMAVGRHFENRFIAISRPKIIRFQGNLVRCCTVLQGRLLKKILKFCKFKMAAGAILKIVFWLYLNEWLSDKREILKDKAESRSSTDHITKIPNFKNLRWRTDAILKMVLSLYISRKTSDFNEIWCADADFASKDGYLT